MKKNMFTLIIAAAAMVASTTFVSCQKEDEPIEVIKSEVLETGSSPIDIVSNGITGTQLAYESWIKVNIETKASGEQLVKAKLQADILASVFEVKADGFEPQPVKVSYSYRENGRKQDGFVTTIDSVMVCKLDYGAFAYEQELLYQVAIYDDGISKQTMPYHRFGELQVGDYSLSALDNAIIRGAEYERMLFRQQLTASFGNQQYVMNNCLVLLKYVSGTETPIEPGEVYQTKTEILDMGIDSEARAYTTWLKARQYFSDGTTKDVLCSAYVGAGGYSNELKYKLVNTADIKIVSYDISEGTIKTGGGSYVTENVNVLTKQWVVKIKYNLFTEETYFYEQEAYYVDDLITYPMPVKHLSDIQVSEPELVKGSYMHSDEIGDYWHWSFKQEVTAKYMASTLTSAIYCELAVQ